jgi:hypothetical protein
MLFSYSLNNLEPSMNAFFTLAILCALLLFAYGTVVSGDSTVSPSLTESPIKITKSLTDNKLFGNASTIVVLKISKQSTSTVNDIRISDIVPPMFKAEPNELFKNNVFQKQIPSFGNADSFTYSISPVKDMALSKDWTFSLPSAQATYKLSNNSQILTAISSAPSITLIPAEQFKWWTVDWPLYLIILILIASSFGAIGGAINYFIKYRSTSKVITSRVDLRDEKYVFEVEYTNYIELGDSCYVKISAYRKGPLPNNEHSEIKCYLFVGGKEEYNFKIEVGDDENHKKETSDSHVINNKNAYLGIRVGELNIGKIDIIFTQKSLSKDVIAGFMAGLVTLLTLQITATVIASEAYPANVQSLITLVVSTLVAGLVPFQILDKATAQLQETVKITREQVREAINQKTILVEEMQPITTDLVNMVRPQNVEDFRYSAPFAKATALKNILDANR